MTATQDLASLAIGLSISLVILSVGCKADAPVERLDASAPLDVSDSMESAASDDATSDAEVDEAGDGSAPEDDSGFDASGLPSLEAGGPPACAGPKDCLHGGICCLNLAAERAPAACVTGSACPSGDAELCGVNGNEGCRSGMCQDYQCTETEPQHVVTFFACNVPLLPTVSCGVTTPSSADAGSP